MPHLSSTRATRMAKRPRRDTQKQHVYEAGWDALPNDVVGATRDEIQVYVDRLSDAAWFRRRWGSRRVQVEVKRGAGGYNPAYSNTVCIGTNTTGSRGEPAGATKRTVLHEVAHVLTGPCEGNWHGPTFVRTLLELVQFEFGLDVAKAYREACRKHRVKVGSPIPLRPDTPPPRPVKRTYRVVIDGTTVTMEATSVLAVLVNLSNPGSKYRAQVKDATEVRVSKSRAVRKAAAAPARKKGK